MEIDAEQQVVRYHLSFESGHDLEITTRLESDAVPPVALADWAKLDFHKCMHCPLESGESVYCPFALSLQEPVRLLAGHPSFEVVEAVVQHRGREIRQQTTLQRAAGSLLGLLGASSGCPHTRFLKPMAWFHLPFSSSDETLFRVLSTYLLGQYIKKQRGMPSDWGLEGLREGYRNLRKVNQGIAKRLQAASEGDSSVNAVVLLDVLAADTLYSLEQDEGELDAYFKDYWQ